MPKRRLNVVDLTLDDSVNGSLCRVKRNDIKINMARALVKLMLPAGTGELVVAVTQLLALGQTAVAEREAFNNLTAAQQASIRQAFIALPGVHSDLADEIVANYFLTRTRAIDVTMEALFMNNAFYDIPPVALHGQRLDQIELTLQQMQQMLQNHDDMLQQMQQTQQQMQQTQQQQGVMLQQQGVMLQQLLDGQHEHQ